MNKSTVIGLTTTLLIALVSTLVWAALPQTMSYQGYLTNGSGTAINTPTSMTFALYSSNPHRNNPVWKETQPAVTVSNGVYNVQMGIVTPITAMFDVPYWLGIKVSSDPEMTPLQPLGTTGYAFTAQNVTGIGPGFTNFIIGRNAGNSAMSGSGNTSVGTNAFQANTSGDYNTAMGTSALRTNTTGNANSAFGYHSLQSSTDGSWNTALGFYSLFSNTTGVGNTASGNNGLFTNTTGVYNTASGKDALYFNTVGNYNTASGFSSLIDNTTGNNNTAVGLLSGSGNTSGFRNTFIGANSIPANPDLVNATAIGANAVVGVSNSMVLGGTGANAVKVGIGTTTPSQTLEVVGTVKATQFIGDGSQLINLPSASGAFLPLSGGTMSGTLSVPTLNVTGNLIFPQPAESLPVLIGLSGGYSLLSIRGQGNFSAGLDAGSAFTNTGTQNTATGNSALRNCINASDNTANGFNALNTNSTGGGNTAVGSNALYGNTNGSVNTAIGLGTLRNNTTGSQNLAIGSGALAFNTTGYYNVATGPVSLPKNTTGNGNTASGDWTLGNNTIGEVNTAVGAYSGSAIIDGNYNTFIGASSDAVGPSLTNATAIGANAVVDASNHVRIGNTNVTQIGGQVGWTNLSDIRIKKDIRDISVGLDFIKALRPMEYKLKQGNDRNDFGFIAQDLEALVGTEYNILGIGGDSDRTLSLRYTDFIAPMVKAMQEQQTIIDNQKQQIKTLEERLSRIESLMSGK